MLLDDDECRIEYSWDHEFTGPEVRDYFFDHGMTIQDFADRNRLNRAIVYAVIHGRTKGKRGAGHTVKVLLCMKSGSILKHPEIEYVPLTKFMS